MTKKSMQQTYYELLNEIQECDKQLASSTTGEVQSFVVLRRREMLEEQLHELAEQLAIT